MKIFCSLGHNSTAIAYNHFNELIGGYEEERFTRIKSDKNFPINAINKLLELHNPIKDSGNVIYLSHWYDKFDVQNKRYSGYRIDYDYLEGLKNKWGFKVESLNDNMTHHDMHAYSAIAFAKSHTPNLKDFHILVADGFGNRQEVISVYSVVDLVKPEINLIQRYYGYMKSLGLMYQYATSYCGMKENEDEYKFLGCEPHIEAILNTDQIHRLTNRINSEIQFFIKHLEKDIEYQIDPLKINITELDNVKNNWRCFFNRMLMEVDKKPEDTDFSTKRIIVAFVIQKIIEDVCVYLIKKFEVKNVLLAGGIFYNVKLNNRIMNEVNKICVMPLAGDQGTTFGYAYKSQTIQHFSNLLIGKRKLKKPKEQENVYYFNNTTDMEQLIIEKLYQDEIVQVVTGDLELGPRALCNTSTLALPTQKNVEIINMLNGRDTVMPMAPVMTKDSLEFFFNKEQIDKVIGSLFYMIITLDYKDEIIEDYIDKYRGIMHKYPFIEKYSGRPQVAMKRNSYIYRVLQALIPHWRALINTSYNAHGSPINYSTEDAIHDFNYQMNKKAECNIDKNVCLIIGDIR